MQVDELLKPFPIKEFHPFPRALVGPGAHEMTDPEALKLGFKKTLVMTSGPHGSDIVNKIVESMMYRGLDVVVYDKEESNPKDYDVMDAVGRYQEHSCDSFVSIGGGSSHDACTGARVSVAHDGHNVDEFALHLLRLVHLGQFGSAVIRRTTILVLGESRGNGKDPRVPVVRNLRGLENATTLTSGAGR